MAKVASTPATASSSYILATALLVGLLLRWRGAVGDLWLDEISTFRLLQPAQSLVDIFLRTPHDNNHYLNSVWMWSIGRDASFVVIRGASIALGVMTVAAAWAAAAQAGRLAAGASAGLFATSYFFVHFGSEARGYAGMVLCILVAKAALDRLLEEERPSLWAAYLGALCIGVFFHMTMVEAAGALALAALVQTYEEGRARRGVWIVLASIVACLPALACFIYGVLSPKFAVGDVSHFTLPALISGVGGAVRATLGLPETFSNGFCALIGAAGAIAALSLLPPQRRLFPIVAIFVLPALHAALMLPNQFYARFHLTMAVSLLLLLAEAGAIACARGGGLRVAAVSALMLFAVMQALTLQHFFENGRGRYSELVTAMTEEGETRFTATKGRKEIGAIVDFFSVTRPLRPRQVQIENFCVEPPDWFIDLSDPSDDAVPPARLELSPPAGGCSETFERKATFRAWGLSGYTCWLYRRVT